ncbi:LytR C-terminal domain-containing protein [Sphingomonas sp. URHD0057]|uniref:LytR C-terminal domain-containing protein n=1 Tax=Sphingomonas sp. URHD0057 TaxID=1380389 RepID=UPI000688B33D|nr:LytR C-terminal domain-containing protein [Sphingomonas sp. URHD0057]
MRGGTSSLVYAGFLVAAGCASTTQTSEVKIRAIPDASAKLRPGSALLADANGQLAIGNVGLALEGFRKALREQPNSADAYAGLARAYEAMGRFDLARSNYEAALALTPKDPVLLTGVADSMDQQGNAFDAAMARREAAAVISSMPVAQPKQVSEYVPIATPALASSITVELPAARPAAPQLAPRPTVTVELPAKAPVAPQPTVTVELPTLARRTDVPIATPTLSSSVTVALPPLRPLQMVSAASAIRVELPLLPETVEAPAPKMAKAPITDNRAPYLERLSLAEVALVTDGRPVWQAQVVAQTRGSTTVRWVPIMMAQARPNIRVLNAAQRQGLAAQSRAVLLDRGWRKIEIGNADARARSVVFYPIARRTLGRSLAAQFGFPAQPVANSNVLVVVLGRDAPRNAVLPKRG